MTAINLATDIPAAINTLEKLHVWSAVALSDLNLTAEVLEAPGVLDRAASSVAYPIFATDPVEWRQISRTSIKLNSNWRRSGKLWLYAEELSTIALPTDYKS